MPPPKSHKTLTGEQKDVLKRWIEQGANWEPHWSLVAPLRPVVPHVKDSKWVKNPIDAFVLAKLEAAGLDPAPQADRATLIRRLSFDLIGLPPTPQEVDAFVNDKSPDAYEKVVDRLLANPHYGEHRARYWMDAARYGDTHGIHIDNYVELWTYRDWVIDAYNRNLPFDKFTVEQIAGDLLPNRTLDQQIATGFHRCNATTSEGGSIDEEVQVMYAKDRVETTCTVWLGITSLCCECHDHKFDPFTMRDFYSMSAFYRNTPQRAMDGNVSNTPPEIPVPKAKDRARYVSLIDQQLAIKSAQEKRKAAAAPAFAKWAATDEPFKLTEPLDPSAQAISLGMHPGEKEEIVATIDGQETKIPLPKNVHWGNGPKKGETALDFNPKGALALGKSGDLEADQPFSLGGWVYVPVQEGTYAVASRFEPGKRNAGWVLEIGSRVPSFRLVGDKDARDALAVKANTSNRLKGGTWAHLFVTYDGSRSPDGLAIYVNGIPQFADQTDDRTLLGSIRNAGPMKLGADNKRDFRGGALRDFRMYRRELRTEEVKVLSQWSDTHEALQDPKAKIAGPLRQNLELLYINRFDVPYRQTMESLEPVEEQIRHISRQSPVALVMAEKPTTRPTANILFRGNYDQPRDQVFAATPAMLPPMPKEWPRNRLGLSWWLVDKANPLTARVTINRQWQEIFGAGIVKSTEDFGSMGVAPSHPELLDWLAVEFREPSEACGCSQTWDIKRMIKLMVMSATYQQSSAATPAKLAADSDNRLLSRGPRFRMDAEVLRDFALAASGLLVDKIGGPSVKPYQPPGVWEAVAMFGSNTRFYKEDSGDSLYRRSMYWFWKRSAPPASMDIFNAPGRLACTVRRERTDTPLQALVTMNDPQWVEAARRLAELALEKSKDDFDARLDYITMRAISRKFNADEREICRKTLAAFSEKYQADKDAAEKLIHIGASKPSAKVPTTDLAAWTVLASQVLNTDEALNK